MIVYKVLYTNSYETRRRNIRRWSLSKKGPYSIRDQLTKDETKKVSDSLIISKQIFRGS